MLDGDDGREQQQHVAPGAELAHVLAAAQRPPQVLEHVHRAGADRLAVEEAAQVVGQRLGALVAVGRVFFQALQADGFQVAIDVRVEQARRGRVALQHLHHGVHRRLGLEGRPAGQALVEDGAEAVNVGGGAQLLDAPGGLLGGHVARRAEDGAGARLLAVVVQPLGQAEVGDVRLVVLVDEDVRRLQIAVQDAVLVGVVDGAGDGLDVAGGDAAGQRPRRQPLRPG